MVLTSIVAALKGDLEHLRFLDSIRKWLLNSTDCKTILDSENGSYKNKTLWLCNFEKI